MKAPEELNALKAEVESLKEKLAGLTEEELKQVAGGWGIHFGPCDMSTTPIKPKQ